MNIDKKIDAEKELFRLVGYEGERYEPMLIIVHPQILSKETTDFLYEKGYLEVVDIENDGRICYFIDYPGDKYYYE